MQRILSIGYALLFVLVARAPAAEEAILVPSLLPEAATAGANLVKPHGAPLTAERATPKPGDTARDMTANFEVEQSAMVNQPGDNFACDECCRPCSAWSGGISAYFLSPHWTGGNASSFSSDFGNAFFTQQNFSAPLSATPAFWFGYTALNGCGVQTDFFDYAQSWSTATVAPPGTVMADPLGNALALPGDPFVATSALKIRYWDLEMTKRMQAWNWTWQATTGLRYLHVGESYNSLATLSTSSSHSFDGWGPTMSLATRRPIGSSGLGFYGSGRFAILFGQQSYATSLFDGLGGQTDIRNRTLGVMPNGQLEFGLDFRRPMFDGRSMLTIETGMVAQAYFDAGVPAASSPPVVLFGNAPPSIDATLGLFGLRTSIGIAY